ncbi:C40 family peptidase [Filimonas effusa]|uniref:Hydrolase Nlp/P60 n=1 Tax=Filimonas effusa TaxID=2508721 RepID=A0A4Q1DCI9_9BACT|nr:C40 family peptidase [Filimonas effusa]RXK86678.1 hydrolase Nlp/P60 [Filimonas effusa]
MTHVVCIVAAAPVRATASHRSEMVSQLLLGEFAEVIESTKDFTRIRGLYDGYEGWVQASQLTPVEAATAALQPLRYTTSVTDVMEMNGTVVRLSIASPVYDEATQLGKYNFKYMGSNGCVAPFSFDAAALTATARNFLNAPYLWGGRSSFGIDCSGFTQQVYKMAGIHLLRDASQQATQGEVTGFLQEARCGDLAFFDNEEGKITHVGILLSSDEIIHASGRVRIDKIDNEGIVNGDTGERTHRLRIIKRVTDTL